MWEARARCRRCVGVVVVKWDVDMMSYIVMLGKGLKMSVEEHEPGREGKTCLRDGRAGHGSHGGMSLRLS